MMLTNIRSLRSVALSLVVLMVVYTIPVSAEEVGSRAASIGSVSAIGSVELRGVGIDGDGTLFSGDRMKVGSRAYARVALGAGRNFEVASGSDVTITREANSIQIHMASGNVAFKGDGKESILLRVGVYEVTVPGNAAGNVAYVGTGAFGVRVLTGSASVRNTATKESFSVQKGSERLISLNSGNVTQPMARVASAVPAAVPAMPQAQQRSGLSKGGWIAVLATLAGAGAAIVVLTTRSDDTDEDAAKRLAQVTALQNISTISGTAAATSALAAAVDATADAAVVAINASNVPNKAALLASANAVIAKAASATTKIANLTADIAALQDQIENQDIAPTAAQLAELDQLLADLQSARNEANTALSDLNTLLNQAGGSGVPGLPPPPDVEPVPDPETASGSNP
jgi:hypothetical protein